MDTRRHQISNQSYDAFLVQHPENIILFLHGLGGARDASYWGRIPLLIANDNRFSGQSIVFWSYESNRWPVIRVLSWKLSGPPDPVEVAISVHESICSSPLIGDRKPGCIVVAHSLGGLIALELLNLEPYKSYRALAFVATPIKTPAMARIANFATFGSNPQLRLIANDSNKIRLLNDGLEACRTNGVHTAFIGSQNDEIVQRPSLTHFDKVLFVDGDHTWMKAVSSATDAAYLTLRSWLLSVL